MLLEHSLPSDTESQSIAQYPTRHLARRGCTFCVRLTRTRSQESGVRLGFSYISFFS